MRHRVSQLQRRIILKLSTRPLNTAALARELSIHASSSSRSLGRLIDSGIVAIDVLGRKYLTLHGQSVCADILRETERDALKVERRIDQPRFSGRDRLKWRGDSQGYEFHRDPLEYTDRQEQ